MCSHAGEGTLGTLAPAERAQPKRGSTMAQYQYKMHYWPGGQRGTVPAGRTAACGRIVQYGQASSSMARRLLAVGAFARVRWHMPRPAVMYPRQLARVRAKRSRPLCALARRGWRGAR